MPGLALGLLAAAGVLAGACGGGGEADAGNADGIRVVATTTQIGALAEVVGGDRIRLSTLMKPGASAHDFQPGTEELKRVHQADLILKHGLGLDDWLDNSISAAGGGARVVTVTDGIQTTRRSGGEVDPHVWHDPAKAAQMVDGIVRALSMADAANEAAYKASGDAYKAKLARADVEVRSLIDQVPAANRKLVTNHDAFGYFLDRYGLTLVGAVIPSALAEGQPSAKEIAALEDLIRRERVKAIFAEEEIDPKVAREISKDTGVTIVADLYADSLGPPGSGAETIDGMLLSNAKKIAEALK